MLSFKDLQEVLQPKAAGEKRFKDKHVADTIDYPLNDAEINKGTKKSPAKKKRIADSEEGKDAAVYEELEQDDLNNLMQYALDEDLDFYELTEEQLDELIGRLIKKGVKKVGGAIKGRVTTSGRADRLKKKAAAIKKKRDDKNSIRTNKQAIKTHKAGIKTDAQKAREKRRLNNSYEEMTPAQEKKRKLQATYGESWKAVMYATATKQAMSEEVDLDEAKYELYHKDFSSAMQHAYKSAKKLYGITIDPEEIDSKVATGPSKPSEGKTNSYRLKGDKGAIQVQVYNKGGSKPFELNFYKEEVEVELDEAKYTGKLMKNKSIVDYVKKQQEKNRKDVAKFGNKKVGAYGNEPRFDSGTGWIDMAADEIKLSSMSLNKRKAFDSEAEYEAIARKLGLDKFEPKLEEVELDEVGGSAFGGTIDKIQKVVDDKQATKIDGVMVDTFTASLIMNIFKKVNKQNQDKMRKMKVTQLAKAAYKLAGMKEEVDLDEGKMSQLHQYIKDKKSAEEIAKLMKVDVKTIKALMSSHHPEEVEEGAAADARRAMSRDKDFSRKDSADDDTDATDDDVKGASKNIIMQLRKAGNRASQGVEFGDGKKVQIPAQMAIAVQQKYNAMKRPADKEKFQARIGKSYKDMLSALKEELQPKKESILERMNRKIKENKHG